MHRTTTTATVFVVLCLMGVISKQPAFVQKVSAISGTCRHKVAWEIHQDAVTLETCSLCGKSSHFLNLTCKLSLWPKTPPVEKKLLCLYRPILKLCKSLQRSEGQKLVDSAFQNIILIKMSTQSHFLAPEIWNMCILNDILESCFEFLIVQRRNWWTKVSCNLWTLCIRYVMKVGHVTSH